MKITLAATTLTLVAVLALAPGSAAQTSPPATAQDVAGRWVSVGCEATPGTSGPQHVKRNLRLTGDAWTVDLTVYADPGCNEPTLGVRVEGPYLLGPLSAAVPGATEALFVEAAVHVTPHSSAAADLLNGTPAGTCGTERWALGVQQSLGKTGCELLDVRTPSAEYELVKREGDRLFLGARPAASSDLNAPERRPTTLNAPLTLAGTP